MMQTVSVTALHTPPPRPEPRGISGTKEFQFIVTSPDLVSKNSGASSKLIREQKRQVRSHVSRGRPRRVRGGRQLPSWTNKTSLPHLDDQQDDSHVAESSASHSLGVCLGHDYQLPYDPKTYAIYGGIQFLQAAEKSLYPSQICEHFGSDQTSGWMSYMLSDDVYLQAIKFSTAAQTDALCGRTKSPSTLHQASEALQLLQKRLDHGDEHISISDPTIMAVVCLAGVGEWFEQGEHVENHLSGLQKMIAMRGGFSALKSTTDELWTKVCRIDLGLALRRGSRPLFFREDMSWDVYLTEGLPKRASSSALNSDVSVLIESRDMKLRNVWLDLTSFSSMANLGHQTGRKIPTALFAEIMVSTLYRLLHQEYPGSPVQESVRLGMLGYAAAMLFQWHQQAELEHQKQHTVQKYTEALMRIRTSELDVPDRLIFWLLVTWSVMAYPLQKGWQPHAEHLEGWLYEMLDRQEISTWKEAKMILKSVMWVDILHDMAGKVVFERTMAGRKTHELTPG